MIYKNAKKGLLAGLLSCAILLSPDAAIADVTTIDSGEVVRVEAYGSCRRVHNTNSNQLMVPHKILNEWAAGGTAFLNATPRDVNITACPCAFDNNSVHYQALNNNHPSTSRETQGFVYTFDGGDGIIYNTRQNQILRYEWNGSSYGNRRSVKGSGFRNLVYLREVSEDGQYIAGVHVNSHDPNSSEKRRVFVARWNGSQYNVVYNYDMPVRTANTHTYSRSLVGNDDLSIIAFWSQGESRLRIIRRGSGNSYSVVFNQRLGSTTGGANPAFLFMRDNGNIFSLQNRNRYYEVTRSGSSYSVTRNVANNTIRDNVLNSVSEDGRFALASRLDTVNTGALGNDIYPLYSVINLQNMSVIYTSPRRNMFIAIGGIETQGMFTGKRHFTIADQAYLTDSVDGSPFVKLKSYRINDDNTVTQKSVRPFGFPHGERPVAQYYHSVKGSKNGKVMAFGAITFGTLSAPGTHRDPIVFRDNGC